MKTYCICSAPTKSDLEKLINKYFCSTNYVITDDNKLYNTKMEKCFDRYIIQEKKSRWQFRGIETK